MYWGAILGLAIAFTIARHFDPKATIGEFLIVLVCVPRLHDIGRSGWWAGGAIAGEVVIMLALLAATHSMKATMIGMGLYVLVCAGLMVVLGLIPGQPGENRFGPPMPALGRNPSASGA
jgi:uncharacterized membrane protein YhaH (DUF805 family)